MQANMAEGSQAKDQWLFTDLVIKRLLMAFMRRISMEHKR